MAKSKKLVSRSRSRSSDSTGACGAGEKKSSTTGSFVVKAGMAQQLKGGVIMGKMRFSVFRGFPRFCPEPRDPVQM